MTTDDNTGDDRNIIACVQCNYNSDEWHLVHLFYHKNVYPIFAFLEVSWREDGEIWHSEVQYHAKELCQG